MVFIVRWLKVSLRSYLFEIEKKSKWDRYFVYDVDIVFMII